MKNPHIVLLSVSLPTPPLHTAFPGGLPLGAIEAIKASYGVVVQILDPPRDGFNLTLKLNLLKLPPDEGSTVYSLQSLVALNFAMLDSAIHFPPPPHFLILFICFFQLTQYNFRQQVVMGSFLRV